MGHVMLAFNPEEAGNYEFADFARCCVFRKRSSVGDYLKNGSIAVIYRSGDMRLIGEFEVVRVVEIDEPKSAEAKELYEKAFGYPVTLYNGEYYGKTHIFYRNLRVYSPDIPWERFMNFRDKRQIGTQHPISHIRLDDEDLEWIRSNTTIATIHDVVDSGFVDPFQK